MEDGNFGERVREKKRAEISGRRQGRPFTAAQGSMAAQDECGSASHKAVFRRHAPAVMPTLNESTRSVKQRPQIKFRQACRGRDVLTPRKECSRAKAKDEKKLTAYPSFTTIIVILVHFFIEPNDSNPSSTLATNWTPSSPIMRTIIVISAAGNIVFGLGDSKTRQEAGDFLGALAHAHAVLLYVFSLCSLFLDDRPWLRPHEVMSEDVTGRQDVECEKGTEVQC